MLICYNLSLLNTHVICALWIGIVNYRKDKYSMAYPLYGLSTKLLSDLNLVDAEVVDDPAEFLGLRREEVEEEVEEEEEEARPIFESSFSERNESYNEINSRVQPPRRVQKINRKHYIYFGFKPKKPCLGKG